MVFCGAMKWSPYPYRCTKHFSGGAKIQSSIEARIDSPDAGSLQDSYSLPSNFLETGGRQFSCYLCNLLREKISSLGFDGIHSRPVDAPIRNWPDLRGNSNRKNRTKERPTQNPKKDLGACQYIPLELGSLSPKLGALSIESSGRCCTDIEHRRKNFALHWPLLISQLRTMPHASYASSQAVSIEFESIV